MKKKKLPKYVQEKFIKPQFKIGDRVKYEFLGEHGWGDITKIHKYNDKISYMVKGKNYTYPCGLSFKEYKSYYAGSIFFEESDEYRRNSKHSGRKKDSSKYNNKDSKQISNIDVTRISSRSDGSSKESDNRNVNTKDSRTATRSRKQSENIELEDAINKQKDFLRKFI